MSTPTGTRRRRTQLTPLRTVAVEFTGTRAAEGPLTLGQLNIQRWLIRTPDHYLAYVFGELEVPAGCSVDGVAGALAVLLGRHESLRTTYLHDEPPRQVVAGSGVLTLEVCSLGEGQWGPRDRPAVAEALIRWLRGSPAPPGLPLRVAVALGPGERVIACAAGISHMAVDHQALEIVRQEFAELVRDPAARTGEPRHQPLDQAEAEATPAARLRAEQALRYMLDQTRRLPRCLYALPGARPTGESLAVELSSGAAAIAMGRVAARTRASRSSIVLAAICAVLARRLGYRELTFPLISSNRFERRLARYVGPLAQGALVTVDVGERDFDALVRQTWTAVIEASRHSGYDAAQRADADQEIEHERGLRFMYDPLFNSLVAESRSALAAGVRRDPAQVPPTELRWRPVPRNGTLVRFGLNQVDGLLKLDLWSTDTGQVPRTEMESLLLAVERLLVAAADGDLDAARIGATIALEPVSRGPDWILLDSCWVDVAQVQQLLDAALAPAVARIFASAGGEPLVAYLTATESVRTPEQAHARCLAVLDEFPVALTPRHYVICATAPPDPADATAWPPPLATGTGRP
ncbi:condensation domain-containing protein [Actinophytocola sp.]|uniref:condensation domain-containing protein n=1 Tax=Actinophytocola sp. TaxID=1872138 RepID=UPI002D7F7C25|nr:condensation domain-containing protein [Actinophytocola sp.]HET9143117.1 condensation domain-containing protein [Actinophytocola sp.]